MLIHNDGRVKIADFGFAKQFIKSTFTKVGTPLYTAPEVLEGNKYGLEADIYGIGVVLYNMVYGLDRYPYEGNTLLQIVKNMREGNLKIPEENPEDK